MSGMRLLGRLFFCAVCLGVIPTMFAQDSNTPPSSPSPSLPPSAPPTRLIKEDRDREILKVQTQAHDLLYSGDYDKLEKTEEELRTSKSRFPSGLYKVSSFYEGLAAPWGGKDEQLNGPTNDSLQKHFQKLDAWKKAKPDSMLADIILANTLSDFVSDDDAIKKARTILDKVYADHQGKNIPPIWYYVLLHLAYHQGWSHKDYDRWFEEAITVDPEYHDFYFAKAYYLLPSQYGTEGDLEKFAEESGEKYSPEMYARIYWSVDFVYTAEKFFPASHANWALMKAGFEDMVNHWPTSAWDMNAYCHFACLAQDKETAKKLFEQLHEKYYPRIWGSLETFQKYEDWASDKTPEKK